MLDFIQKFIYYFMSLQEKTLRRKSFRNTETNYSNATSKRVFGFAASLEISSQTKNNKIKLESSVKNLLKKYDNDPDKLLEFVKKSGTDVYRIPFADKILGLIGYEEGFISSMDGFKALYLNIVVSLLSREKINFSLHIKPMFVLRNMPPDIYCMVQQFYKWYAMKLNLPGFDSQSQKNFQKFLAPSQDENIKELSIEEILGLKEAIARDVEAINFIVDLAKNTSGSKNAMKKIVMGGASV